MAVDSFAVQTAIFAALATPLGALTPPCAVVDLSNPNQPFPFVELSRFQQVPENYLDRDVTRYRATLTVNSDYRGQRQVHQILDAIRAALDDADLALEAGTAVRCDLENSDVIRDADGVTFIGSAIYSLIVEH